LRVLFFLFYICQGKLAASTNDEIAFIDKNESNIYEIWFEGQMLMMLISQPIGAQNWQQRQEQASAYSFHSSHHRIRIQLNCILYASHCPITLSSTNEGLKV
jgi:hypothetical protein